MNSLSKSARIVISCIIVAATGFLCYYMLKSEAPVTDEFFALDTYVTFELYGKNADEAIEKGKEVIEKLEAKFNPYDENSVIYKYNHAETGEKFDDKDLLELANASLYISGLTGGAFDMTVFPVSELWDIKNAKEPPEQQAISEALENVGYERILIEDDCLIKTAGTQLDPGGIAKGYITDKLRVTMAGYGINRGIINLGGNVIVLGSKDDGVPFNIGIANPYDENEVITSVFASNTNVVTSGTYQRYFEHEGKRYHHILSPETGYPADNGFSSVTIIDDSGVFCDGLSTAVFVMGSERGISLLENLGIRAVVVTDRGELIHIN